MRRHSWTVTTWRRIFSAGEQAVLTTRTTTRRKRRRFQIKSRRCIGASSPSPGTTTVTTSRIRLSAMLTITITYVPSVSASDASNQVLFAVSSWVKWMMPSNLKFETMELDLRPLEKWNTRKCFGVIERFLTVSDRKRKDCPDGVC